MERLRKEMQVNELGAAELDRMREKVQPVVEKFTAEVEEALAREVASELARLRGSL